MRRRFERQRMYIGVIVVIATFLLFGSSVAFSADKPAAPAYQAQTGIKKDIPAKSDMDTLTAIFTRRSIRNYTNQPVSDATVKLLLQAAMAAPSAKNDQSWEFIIIRDKDTLKKIVSFHPFSKHLPGAQVGIVVCGNKKLEAAPGHWIPAASNASMNILLAAHSLGLGAVWTTFYPYADRTEGIRKLLNLPDHIMPLNIIPIGYPAVPTNYQDRFNPAKIHYEKW